MQFMTIQKQKNIISVYSLKMIQESTQFKYIQLLFHLQKKSWQSKL